MSRLSIGPGEPVRRTEFTPRTEAAASETPASALPEATVMRALAVPARHGALGALGAHAPAGDSVPTEPLADLVTFGERRQVAVLLDAFIAGAGTPAREAEVIELLARGFRGEPAYARKVRKLTALYGLDVDALRVGLERDPAFRRLVRSETFERSLSAYAEAGVGSVRVALLRSLFAASTQGRSTQRLHRLAMRFDNPDRFGSLLTSAIDKPLYRWVKRDRARLQRAEEIVQALAPEDLSLEEYRAVDRVVDNFRRWADFPYDVIVVPGFSPRDGIAQPGVHPTAQRRLVQAKADFDAGKAPFVLLSGSNVWPNGTPYYEALEMKKALIAMGVPGDRIIVDTRARHSTTNLRNAGRYMQAHGMNKALITTTFDQDFYFSASGISTFDARCMIELGYRVGRLRDVPFDPMHSVFMPSSKVRKVNIRDPLDP